MKKSLKIAFISLTSLVLTIGASISIPFSIDSYKSNISEEKLINNNELKYIDYFNETVFNANKNDNEKLKSRITKIINKYRLYEWNYYFQNQSNNLIKSNVLESKYGDYKEFINNNKIKPNSLFKDYKIEYTNRYLNQDEQFRFFNDFINIVNEENSKNEEDFLYLRWQYYAYEAASKYHSLKYDGKHIYEITIDDWALAIQDAIIPPWIPDKLFEMLYIMLCYYGLVPFIDGDDFEIDYDFNPTFLEPCIVQMLICSKDMVMRLSSVDDFYLNKHPVFKNKGKRAMEINDEFNKYYDVLINSLTGDPNMSGLDQNLDQDKFNIAMKQLKEIANKILDLATSIAHLDLKHYANVSQIDKYGSINVKDIIRKN